MKPDSTVNAADLIDAMLPVAGIDATHIDRTLVEAHVNNAAAMAAAVFSVPLSDKHLDLASVYEPQEVKA